MVVPAALVNAWFLWPLAAYGGGTQIGTNVAISLTTTCSPERGVRPARAYPYARPPDRERGALGARPQCSRLLAIGWVLVTLVILLARRSSRTPWATLALILVLVAGAVLIAMTNVGIILALPSMLHALQFSYRLETYILACLAGALLCALVLPGRNRHGAWLGALAVILALMTLDAARQVNHHLHGDPYASFTFPVLVDYVDGKLPMVAPSWLPVVTVPWPRSG